MMFRLLLALSLTIIVVPVVDDEAGKVVIGGPISPDGKAIVTCDIPIEMRHANRVGTDGKGLCVFASVDHSAAWQNDERTIGIFAKMQKEKGAGWPAKLTRMMEKYAAGANYVQYEGANPAILDLALKTGRMPSVTYYGDHMVNLVFLNEHWACCLDNNHIGERELRWFTREEFVRNVWTAGGNGWAVVLLAPRPPAPPRNSEVQEMDKASMMCGYAMLLAACMNGGEAATKATAPPAATVPAGVVRSICPECERCECNGCECSYAAMMQAVGQGGGKVPDDSAWPSLTFIGSKEDTGRARGALEEYASTAEAMRRFCVQEFRPTNPLITRAGFLADGKPTIYAQRPDGRVIFRLDSFPGADAMAPSLEAAAREVGQLRSPDRSYDPAKDGGLLPKIEPKVNAEITPSAWMLLLSHAASALVGGLGLLGGRWAIVAMVVEPMLKSLEERLTAKLKPPAPSLPA